MRSIVRMIFFTILVLTGLFSAEINSTIVEGNATVYHRILKTLNKEQNKTEDTSLSILLTQQLLAADKPVQPGKTIAFPIKNDSDYRRLFIAYLQAIKQMSSVEEQLKKNHEKITTIESEINLLEPNSTRLLPNELQDAYYHKSTQLLSRKQKQVQETLHQYRTLLLSKLRTVFIDRPKTLQGLRDTKGNITKHEAQIKKLEITREQEALASNVNAVKQIDASLKDLREDLQQETLELLAYTYQLFAYDVQNKNPKAFQRGKELLDLISRYHILSQDETATYIQPLLLELEKTYIGRLKTLTGSSKAEVENALYQTWQFANQPLFSIGQTPISLLKLVITILIFVFGFLAGGQYKKRINRLTANRSSFTSSTRTLLANLGYYLIITIAFFIGLNILGVKLSSIALVAGALSVGIGFGLQNIVSNFISGLILMFERSIKIGDYIEVDDRTQGYVTDIRMRATTVTTNENIDIIIPNQDFIQKNVVNWTMSDNIRRFSIPFGVKYGTSPEKVIRVILDAVRSSDLRIDVYESATRQTNVIMTEMADSSVNFELFVWVRGDQLHKPKRTRSEFLILIYNTLYANNIEIPFPQQDIHIRSVESDIPVHIHSDE